MDRARLIFTGILLSAVLSLVLPVKMGWADSKSEVFIHVGGDTQFLGTKEFLYSFFSTVSVRLESGKWGSRFPVMKQLAGGGLKWEQAGKGLVELSEIVAAFKEMQPKDLVWNMNDRDKQPPWDNWINSSAGALTNCFVTEEGKDLLKVLRAVLTKSKRGRRDIYIE